MTQLRQTSQGFRQKFASIDPFNNFQIVTEEGVGKMLSHTHGEIQKPISSVDQKNIVYLPCEEMWG